MTKYTGWIYKITNTINNKVYIGQTYVGINKRFKLHLKDSENPKATTYKSYFKRAIRKHGKEAFVIEQLYEIVAYSKESRVTLLDTFERFYISKYKSNVDTFGYNSTKGGQMPKSDKEDIILGLLHRIKYEGCCVEGCKRPHLANGYCSLHYLHMYTYGCLPERLHSTPNEIVLYDDYAEVKLYDADNKYLVSTFIDLDDIEKVKQYKWHLTGSNNRGNYATNNLVGRLHNYIVNCPEDKVIIHINKNGLDNRKSNLLIVTLQEKQRRNKIQKTNNSGVKGVWWCKDRNKWQALITINNKTKSLGRFNFFEDAVKARKEAEEKYYT